MNINKVSTTEVTSYAGGVTAIGASLTLTQFGVVVGIITALLTFVMNMYFSYRKDKREQEHADLESLEIKSRLRVLEQQNVPKPQSLS